MSISVHARAIALVAVAISIPAGAAPRVTGAFDDLTVGTGSPPAWSESGGRFTWSAFTVDATGLSAAAPDAQFRYAFESARVAGSPLAATSATPALDATGAVLFDRGAIRERYVALPAGVEQLFDVDALPAPGDLVVRGTVSGTAAFDPSRSSPSLLTYGPFTVSRAVAYDASGASIELALAHVDGGLEITVPAAWLATAALPITIDPFITTETPFDTPASGALPIRCMDVAYNAAANEYFIVYSYQPAGATGDMDVYGRRVDASTGIPLGTPFAIEAGAAFTSREPAVAWNSAANTYLVAFADSPVGTLTHIMGRVLDATGADTGAGKFAISPLSVGPEELWPDVAFDGTNFLVVWGRNDGTGSFDAHAQRVSPAGAAVGGVLNLEVGAPDSRRPCVAFGGGTYLAAWSEAPTTAGLGAIRARTVSAAGALGTTATVSTTAAQDHDWPHAAAAASEFIVVWDSGPTRNNSLTAAPSPDLNFRRVSTAGTPLGAGQVAVVAGTAGAQLGDVAWSSLDDDYVIVWMSGLMAGADTQIRLARVNAGSDTLPEVNTLVSSSAGTDDLVPAVAARGGTAECLIAWSRLTPGAGFAFFERLYATSTAPPGGGGGGGTPAVPVGRDNPNGNQLFNDTLCGDGASAHAGSLAWVILVLAAALELALRRH